MLRIKLLKQLYDEKCIHYLLLNFDKFTVDLIGSYLVKGYTVDNSTYKTIHTMESHNSYSYFYKTIWEILNEFDNKHDRIEKVKHCEYLFRYLNMYYPIVESISYHNFVVVTKEKIIELHKDCMKAIHDEVHLIRHNVNTRSNKRKKQYMELLCIHVDKFRRESKECLIHLNSIINQHSVWI